MANCKLGICNICTMAVTIGPIKFHACMEVNKCDIIIPPDEVHNFNIHLFFILMRTNLCNALVIQEDSYSIANINLETIDTIQKNNTKTNNSNSNY